MEPRESAPTLRRVLLVDDDADVLSIARFALERVGKLVVEGCTEGGEAVGHAQRFAPDLILLDVMMPGVDGPTTLRALRADPATAAIPVVFMTAKVQPQEVSRYRNLGALDVIIKPFAALTLASTLQEVWRRR